MLRFILLLCAWLIISLCTCVVSVNAAFGAELQTKGWLLVQQHKQLGLQNVYLTHDAVKIVNKNFNFVVLIAPPYREVAIYRPDDRTAFFSTPKQFQSTTFLPAGFPPPSQNKLQKLQKVGEETINGLHIIKYRPQSTADELWTINNIDLAPPVLEVIHSYFQIDQHVLPYRKIAIFYNENSKAHSNIWLSVTLNDSYKGKTVWFDTRSVKEMKFTAKDFAYPVGYKKLEKASQALFSKSGTSKLDDMIEDMAIGVDLGKSEKSGNSAQPKK